MVSTVLRFSEDVHVFTDEIPDDDVTPKLVVDLIDAFLFANSFGA